MDHLSLFEPAVYKQGKPVHIVNSAVRLHVPNNQVYTHGNASGMRAIPTQQSQGKKAIFYS
jgi:hypothetical protein